MFAFHLHRIADTFIQTHQIKTHKTGIHRLWMTWTPVKSDSFHFKIGKICLSLTAVGYSKTVRHFQVVDVGRQSEFRGAKLNHPYPKRAVLLVRAPWKESPWNPNITISYTCTLCSGKRHFPRKCSQHFTQNGFFFFEVVFMFELMGIHTNLNTGWASMHASP